MACAPRFRAGRRRTRPFSLCDGGRGCPSTRRPRSMGKKSRKPKKWFGRGGHQRYAGRPVDVDLVNTKERASQGSPLPPSRGHEPDASGNKKVGTFTRASEETMRQRRIVSVAGRFKGGSAPGGSGAATQDLRDDEREELEAKLEKVTAARDANVACMKKLEARKKELEAGLFAEKLLPPPPPPASKPAQDPRAISVAVAVAKAAAKTVPPHQHVEGNAQYRSAIAALGDTILLDENDRAEFCEYLDSLMRIHVSPEPAVDFIACWPRLRKDWSRMRRRICSYCGKGNLDPSVLAKPRNLVCGGCGEGCGVARYCSEACQREHWPEHQKNCMKFHCYTGNAHKFVETKMHRKVMQNCLLNENRAQGRTVTPDHILRMALQMENKDE
jgi:hypothetical protein